LSCCCGDAFLTLAPAGGCIDTLDTGVGGGALRSTSKLMLAFDAFHDPRKASTFLWCSSLRALFLAVRALHIAHPLQPDRKHFGLSPGILQVSMKINLY
jgi:hypothetical protein